MKFGNLVSVHMPVFIVFTTKFHDSFLKLDPVLKQLSNKYGEHAKFIKIDDSKNETLSDALRVNTLPTYMIYRSGKMKWRSSRDHNFTELENALLEQIK